MSNSLFKKLIAGVSATAITLSIVAPVTSVSAAATDAEIEAANKLAAAQVIVDNSANVANYKLGDNITRREMAKVMMNLSGVEVENTCEGKFADLPAEDWGCKYAEAALNEGFVADNAKFGADNNISKWESLKFILNARGIGKAEGVEPYQAAYVQAAVDNGVITQFFDDYNIAATRGWIFLAGAESLEVEEDDEDEMQICEIFGNCEDDENTDTDDENMDNEDQNTDDEDDTVDSDVEGKLLEVALSPDSPRRGERIPEATPRVTMMKLEVSAGDEDVELEQITLEAIGFGAPSDIDDVVLYNAQGNKITRQRNISSSDQNVELDFLDNFTVKAGTTQTLTVSAQIADSAENGDVYGLKVTDLEASASVEGLPVEGAELESVTLSAQGELKIDADKATQDITIGEDSRLAGWKLKVDDDEESMTLRTLRIKQTGSVSEDDIVDLYLEVDGDTLLDNLEFDGEFITMNFGEGYVFDKDKTSYVYFELRGTVTGEPADTIQFVVEELNDIYAVGNKNGYNVPVNEFDDDFELSDALDVEGSEITVSFDRGDQDASNKDTDEFDFGTLTMKANSGNYNLEDFTITLTVDAQGSTEGAATTVANDVLEDIRLGGVSSETDMTLTTGQATETVEIDFSDIVLPEGEEKELKLTADITSDVRYGVTYKFDVSFEDNKFKLVDEDSDTNYVTTDDAADILSSYSGFDSREVEIESATLEFENENIDSTDIVLGNVITQVYKGTVEAGSAADVRLRKLTFTNINADLVDDLDDVVAKAFLKIGTKTIESTEFTTNTVVFNDLAETIEKGVSNRKTVELSLQFKDADISAIATNDDKVQLAITAAEAEDKEVGSTVNPTFDATDTSNIVTLATAGSLTIDIDTVKNDSSEEKDLNYKDRFVLGGTNSVMLAKLEMEAEKEKAQVKDLTVSSATFTSAVGNDSYDQAVNFKNSFENVRIVKEDKSTVVGNAGNFEVIDPTSNGAATDDDEYVKVFFEDMDLVVDTDEKEVYYVVADVKKVDLDSDAASATSGVTTTFTLEKDDTADYQVEGDSSDETLVEGSTLTLDAGPSKSVTVIAADVAGIAFNKTDTVLASGDNQYSDIAEIVITPASSNNVDAEDNTIKAALKKLVFNESDVVVSGASATPTIQLVLREEDSGNYVETTPGTVEEFAISGGVTIDNINTLIADDAAEIEGTTTFVLGMEVTDATLDADSKVTVKLDRSKVEFVDGTSTNAAVKATYSNLGGLDIEADTAGVAGNDLTVTIVDSGDADLGGNSATLEVAKTGDDITITFQNDTDAGNAWANPETVTLADIIEAIEMTAGADTTNGVTVTVTNDISGDITATVNSGANATDAAAAAAQQSLTGGSDASIGGTTFKKVYATGAQVTAD